MKINENYWFKKEKCGTWLYLSFREWDLQKVPYLIIKSWLNSNFVLTVDKYMYVAPRFYLLIAVANLKITDCFETPGIFCFRPCLLLFCRPATPSGQKPSAYYLFMSIYGHLFAEKGLWIPDYLLTCLLCIMDNANRAMSINSAARTAQSINVNVSVLMVIGILYYDNANHHQNITPTFILWAVRAVLLIDITPLVLTSGYI